MFLYRAGQGVVQKGVAEPIWPLLSLRGDKLPHSIPIGMLWVRVWGDLPSSAIQCQYRPRLHGFIKRVSLQGGDEVDPGKLCESGDLTFVCLGCSNDVGWANRRKQLVIFALRTRQRLRTVSPNLFSPATIAMWPSSSFGNAMICGQDCSEGGPARANQTADGFAYFNAFVSGPFWSPSSAPSSLTHSPNSLRSSNASASASATAS